MHYAIIEEKNTSREALYARLQAGYRAMTVQGAYIYVDPLGIRHNIYCAVQTMLPSSRMTGVGGVSARVNAVYMYHKSGLKKKCLSRRPSWPSP